jgi:hypothetical protein
LKFRGGFSQVNYKHILAAVLGAATLLASSGCGTSDKLASLTITQKNSSSSSGFMNLQGIGGTLQLVVTANYTSGKTVDETNFSTFTVNPDGTLFDHSTPLPAPPLGMTISPTGMLTAVDPAICTWTNSGTDDTPSWFLTGNYMITATYKGIVSQPVFVAVASSSGDGPGGACGPS